MRAATAIVLAGFLLALIGAGCGGQEDSTPLACLEGPGAYAAALRAAPGEVRVGEETPISECLAPNQTAGDLANVGATLVEVATELNAQARAQPAGPAALRLGYLVGAAQKGAEQTEGIHADLIRRLTVAARFAPDADPLSTEFRTEYAEGFDAGHAHG
jgi:hypothetical protein